MTREDAIRKLMVVAKERFNTGKSVMINGVPFFNYGHELEMEINEDDDIMAIMSGPFSVTYLKYDMINEINMDFSNILLDNDGHVFGYINDEYFECE